MARALACAVMAVVPRVCLPTAVTIVFYPVIYPPPALAQTLPPPFKVFVGYGLHALGSQNGLGRLAVGGNVGDGMALYPIHFLIYVTLTNNQDIPTTILGYRAYDVHAPNPDSPDDESPLCGVPLRYTHLYFLAPHANDASEFSAANSLDNKLAERTIRPHESVSGWLALQCKDRGWCMGPVKLRFLEASGNISESDQLPMSDVRPTLQNSALEPVATHVDLTKTPIKLMDACTQMGDTGLSLLAPEH